MINTNKFCEEASFIYGLDTSQVPEYIESFDDTITVGCVLHGEYQTKAQTVRRRKSIASPGCPRCQKVPHDARRQFQFYRKVREKYGV